MEIADYGVDCGTHSTYIIHRHFIREERKREFFYVGALSQNAFARKNVI